MSVNRGAGVQVQPVGRVPAGSDPEVQVNLSATQLSGLGVNPRQKLPGEAPCPRAEAVVDRSST